MQKAITPIADHSGQHLDYLFRRERLAAPDRIRAVLAHARHSEAEARDQVRRLAEAKVTAEIQLEKIDIASARAVDVWVDARDAVQRVEAEVALLDEAAA